MGEAYIIKRQSNNSAVIKVKTIPNATITCSDGKTNHRRVSDESGVAEFSVTYGTWTLTKTNSDNTTIDKTVIVNALKVYNVELFSGIFGIQIDQSISDPTEAVTYTDDAVGLKPLSVNLTTGECDYGDWEGIIKSVFGVRPCLVSNGSVYKYLNPNDYTKTEDGMDVSSIIQTGNYDVMVEFKKTWYKWEESGNIIKFTLSDHFINTTYRDYAFATELYDPNCAASVLDAVICDYMYYGAYEGCISNNSLRSLSNKTPYVYSKDVSLNYNTLKEIRGYANGNNTLNSGIESFFKYNYILSLLLLVTKSRDLLSKLGYGVIRSSNGLIKPTGTLNNRGLFCGFDESSGKSIKCFGIENLWGNTHRYCDGILIGTSEQYLVDKQIFFRISPPHDQTARSFVPITSKVTRDQTLYTSTMTTNGYVIIPNAAQADNSIGWVSSVHVRNELNIRGAIISGYENSTTFGPWGFALCVNTSDTSISYNDVGARIVMTPSIS